MKAGLTESDKLKPRCALLNVSEEDVLNIPELNEPEILSFLYKRFEKGLIMTYTGTILLAMNPFEEVKPHNSSSRLIQDFASTILRETLDPKSTKIHAILISGESGSGKTEISKLVLKAFGTRKQKDDTSGKDMARDVLGKLLLSNKILESFGNARTATTANSSRFGKLVHVFFNEEGELAGCSINTYLLESSRIFTQQAGERNYNIFYQLLAGASEVDKKELLCKPCNDFFLTNQGGVQRGGTVLLDGKQFVELNNNFEQLGFGKNQLQDLYRMLMGVLYLGEVTFDDYIENTSDRSKIAHANMTVAAKLLGLNKKALDDLLTTKVLIAPNKETFTLTLNAAQSGVSRDALVKMIFKASFDWVVHEVNKILQPADINDQKRKVMVLDMFGFDSFQRNSIDQLCINYVNEALQQQFNEHIFRMEVKLYEEEGIKFEKIKFSDNKENVDLIVGIFRILDDQCRLPNPTDKRFVSQIYKEFDNNRLFAANKSQQRESKFSITHFAGVVEYTADDFIVKNIDNVPQMANKTFADSGNSVMNAIFSAIMEAQNAASTPARKTVAPSAKNFFFDKNKKGAAPAPVEEEPITPSKPQFRVERSSLVAQIKSELNALMKQIESAAPHYIRCVKPFDKHALGDAANPAVSATAAVMRRKSISQMHSKIRFNQFKVAQQLHYGGVFEAVRIARSGFRSRMTYYEFYVRYRFMTKSLDPNYNDPLMVHPDIPQDEMIRICKNLIDILAVKEFKSDKNSASRVKKISAGAGLGSDEKQVEEQMTRGLIDSSQLQLGESKVFLRKKEYDILELFRNRSLSTCVVLIQAVVRGFCKHHRFYLMRRNVIHAQRLARGHLARKWVKMQRILLVSVVTLQRRFRKKRFFRGIVKLQAIVRRLRAIKVVKILQERRAKLLSAYGVLMSGRELRMHRRRLQASKKSSMPVISYLKRRHLHIPPPEIRLEERNYEDDNLTEIIEKVMNSYETTQNEDSTINLTLVELCDLLKSSLEVIVHEQLKKKILKLTEILKAPEWLLKPDVIAPNSSLYSKIFGSSSSKGTITISSSSAAEVHIHPNHPIFSDIMYVVHKIHKVEAIIIKEIQSLNERFPGKLTIEDAEQDFDEMDIYHDVDAATINARKHYKALIDLQENCGYLRKHYENYASSFVREFGDNSSFCKSFPARTVYVKSLLTQIIEARKTPEGSLSKIKKEQIRKSTVCPLVVEWDVQREEMEKAQMMNRRVQMIEEANIQDSEILSKLAIADKRREELSTANLRIIELKGIGYQFMPYAPGITYSLNTFNELVAGSFLAGRKLTKVMGARNMAGKSAIYEACVGATNTSFMDVLYNPVNVEQIDSVSFTATLITCCVMGILNLQPNHLLVTYNSDTTNHMGTSSRPQPGVSGYAQLNCIKIAGFNNDESLTNAFLDHHNPNRKKIHAENMNMLFFLPQMDEPVDPDVKAFLTAHSYKSEEIVSHWLRDLHDQNQRIQDLKAARISVEELKDLYLPILMVKGCVHEINKRLKHICKLLAESEEEENANHMKSPVAASGAGGSKNMLHRNILHDFVPYLSDYYDHERANAGFAEGIDGVSGVISYAHVYHECLEAEKRIVKAHKRRLEQLQFILPTVLSPQQQETANTAAGTKKKGIFGFGGGDKTKKAEEDDFVVDDNLYVEKKNDDFQGFNPNLFKDILPPQDKKKKQTVVQGSGEAYFDEGIFNTRDEFDSDAMLMEVQQQKAAPETPVGGTNPMAGRMKNNGAAITQAALKKKHNNNQQDEVEDFVPLVPDVDLNRRTSVFAGDSPMKQRKLIGEDSEDDGSVVSASKIGNSSKEAKGIYSKGEFLATTESPLRARPPQTAARVAGSTKRPDGDDFRTGSTAGTTMTLGGNDDSGTDDIPEYSGKRSESNQRARNAETPKKKPVDLGSRIRNAQKESQAFVKHVQDGHDGTEVDMGALYGGDKEFGDPKPVKSGATEGLKTGGTKNIADSGLGINTSTLPNSDQPIEDGTPTSRFSAIVEDEAHAFLKSINFKNVAQHIANESDMKKFCSTLGKNLSFLPSLWFVNINENQLKFFFKYWLNIIVNKKFDQAKIKLQTKEIYLQYVGDEDERAFININKSALLYQLKFHLKISIKIVQAKDEAGKNARKAKSPWRRLTSPMNTGTSTPANGGNPLVGDAQGFESKEYNISDYDSNNKKSLASSADQTLDSDDEITPSDYQLKERLQKILFSCSNLMTAKDFKEAKQKVEVVKRVIHHVCSTEHDYIDGRTVRAFSAILLEYPGLAKIGEVVAERKAFTKDKQIIHKILSHPLVERYSDLLIVLLKNHPDMLWLSDFDTGLLPCDRIKRIPDNKPYKYKLLCKFVNFAGSQPSLAAGGSIFSSFKGEEELIIRAAQHGLMASEAELRSKEFDMLKKCQAPFVPSHNGRQGQGQLATPGTAGQVKDEALLWRLFVEEINGDEKMRNRAWETYELVSRSMKHRMSSTGQSATNIEILMWKSLDLEGKSADKCVIYHVSQRTLERSRILQDLKINWMPGTRDKTSGTWKPSLTINTEVSRKRFGTLRPMTTTTKPPANVRAGIPIPPPINTNLKSNSNTNFNTNPGFNKPPSPIKSSLSSPRGEETPRSPSNRRVRIADQE